MKYLLAAIAALIVVLQGTGLSAFPTDGSQTSQFRVKVHTFVHTHAVNIQPAPRGLPNLAVIWDDKGFWIVINGDMANMATWEQFDEASKAIRGK